MGYRVDQRGRAYDFRRTLNTGVHAELLIGKGWEAVAHAEIRRMCLVVNAYHQQLDGYAGFKETGDAVEALKLAAEAIENSMPEEEDYL